MRWFRIALAATTICLGLAGLGLALGLSASASGSTPAPRVQVDSVYCNGSGVRGQATHGSCTYLLTDGRRFLCPLSFSNRPQTPASLTRATACRPLSPIRIPASWKPALKRLDRVEACLTHHGVRARGGPALTNSDPTRGPIGELDAETKPAALIAFYTSVTVARGAEARVISAVRRVGGSAQRRGAVTIAWMGSPSAQIAGAVDSCAFAARP